MRPELEAIKLLEEVGINSLPVDPRFICDKLGIFHKEDFFEGIEGVFVYCSSGAYIGINSNIRAEGRKKFTYAHELGHYCMDIVFGEKVKFIETKETIESFYQKEYFSKELRANIFASELLMPRFIYKDLVDELDPGWGNVKELAGRSQTSLTATTKRFIDLTDHACALIVSKEKKILWFCKSKEFLTYIKSESGTIPYQTKTYEIFNGITPPNDFEYVDAGAWLSGRGVKEDREILEWALPINSYGHVLTLLWDEEGLAGFEEEEYEDEEELIWEPPTFHKSKRKR